MRIGIAGLGTVAQGLLRLLNQNSERVNRQASQSISVSRLASRSLRVGVDLSGTPFSTSLDSLINDEVDVVVELIGGTTDARSLIEQALRAGKSVVTANKAVLAECGNELFALAQKNQVHLCFEAAVAAGIPIVSTLKDSLVGNTINSVTGILNGTSHFILTRMDEDGISFEEALADAQDKGYAEADPSFDLGGMDAAQKLVILGSLAFDHSISSINDLYVEGIESIEVDDFKYARELGFRIKPIALARRVGSSLDMRVHPSLVPNNLSFADVTGVNNAIVVEGNGVGVLMLKGPGAGGSSTASAVLGDIVGIARKTASLPTSSDSWKQLLPIEDTFSAYYLNLPVADEPGVMAKIADVLAQNNVSMDAVIQRPSAGHSKDNGRWVPVVILTNRVQESVMNDTLRDLGEMHHIRGRIHRIRVADLT